MWLLILALVFGVVFWLVMLSEWLTGTPDIKGAPDEPDNEAGQGSQALRDLMAIPSDVMDMLGEYGRVLAELCDEGYGPFLPASKLPYAKEEIRRAFDVALRIVKDEDMRSPYEICLDRLEHFIPDEEIPEDPQEHLRIWFARIDWARLQPKTKEMILRTLAAMITAKYGDEAEHELDKALKRLREKR